MYKFKGGDLLTASHCNSLVKAARKSPILRPWLSCLMGAFEKWASRGTPKQIFRSTRTFITCVAHRFSGALFSSCQACQDKRGHLKDPAQKGQRLVSFAEPRHCALTLYSPSFSELRAEEVHGICSTRVRRALTHPVNSSVDSASCAGCDGDQEKEGEGKRRLH